LSSKADLVEKPLVSELEMNELLQKYGIKAYFRTSSKNGFNIETAFQKLVEILEESGKI
jgi:hypothetical protein